MKKILIIFLALTACGGGGWPKKDQDKYLDACTSSLVDLWYSASDAREFCDCTLSGLQDAYPTFKDFSKDANKTPLPHEIIDVVAVCE